jgi:hypothetical protein
MNRREKTLAIGVAALVGLLAIYYLFDSVAAKFADRDRQLTDLNQKIKQKQDRIDAGVRAQKKMADWNRRSLPSDAKQAPSLYQSWLLQLVDGAKLASATVQQQSTVGHTGTFEKYAFQIKADSDVSMNELVQFLYQFYCSNQLHRIRQLLIKPHSDGKALEVTIEIEALLLPGADRRDKLSTEKLDKLALGNVGAYEKAIGDRNLFSEYTPPRAQVAKVEPPKRQPVDVAKFATVTGIVEQNDEPQIWVLVKTTGELLKLHEGEDFTVGDLKCKVVKIGVRNAVITAEGKKVQVSVGDNLRDATPLPADEL